MCFFRPLRRNAQHICTERVDGKADAPCKDLFAMRKSYQTCRDRRKVHVRTLLIVGTWRKAQAPDGPCNDYDPNKIGIILIFSPVVFNWIFCTDRLSM